MATWTSRLEGSPRIGPRRRAVRRSRQSWSWRASTTSWWQPSPSPSARTFRRDGSPSTASAPAARRFSSFYLAEECSGTEPHVLVMPGSPTRLAAFLAGAVDAAAVMREDFIEIQRRAPDRIGLVEDFGIRWPDIAITGVMVNVPFSRAHAQSIDDLVIACLAEHRAVAHDPVRLARLAQSVLGAWRQGLSPDRYGVRSGRLLGSQWRPDAARDDQDRAVSRSGGGDAGRHRSGQHDRPQLSGSRTRCHRAATASRRACAVTAFPLRAGALVCALAVAIGSGCDRGARSPGSKLIRVAGTTAPNMSDVPGARGRAAARRAGLRDRKHPLRANRAGRGGAGGRPRRRRVRCAPDLLGGGCPRRSRRDRHGAGAQRSPPGRLTLDRAVSRSGGTKARVEQSGRNRRGVREGVHRGGMPGHEARDAHHDRPRQPGGSLPGGRRRCRHAHARARR